MSNGALESPAATKPVSLVSGAAGFLGSHLVDRLLKEGHRVIGLDNLATGSTNNLKDALTNPDFAFIQQDIIEEITVPAGKVDYVWHLACPASPVDYRRLSIETMMVCSLGTKNLLDLTVRHSAGFLLASTSEVYGDPLVHPQTETYWGNVNPVGERACYDEGKRFAEALTMEYRRRYGINARIVRIFNTYGPRMQINDGRMVPNFICQALRREPLTIFGDGNQTRSLVYVDDEVDGVLRAMTYPDTDGQAFNIGNPEEYTVLDFARIVAGLCCVEELTVLFRPLPPDDPARRCPDIGKTQRLLDWGPRTSLTRGLRETVNYFSQVLLEQPQAQSR